MSRTLSLHLDGLRALAALCVLFHHYNDDIIRGSRHVFPNVGQEAVMAFFALSGFVIAWVAEERERTMSEYLIRRLARLWSVLLPSIAVILFAIAVAQFLPASALPRHDQLAGGGTVAMIGLKAAAAVAFANWNIFLPGFYLPWSGIMWSLTCEFWYYVLFAFWTFIPRWYKWPVLAGIALFLGPGPLLLMPVWIMGVCAQRISRRFRLPPRMAFLCLVAAGTAIVLLWQSGLRFSRLRWPETLWGIPLDTARYAPYYWLLGVLFMGYLVAASSCHFGPKPLLPSWMAAVVRRIAGTSFFLYLTHYPVMQLTAAITGKHEPFPFFIPLVAFGFALVVGAPIENSKRWYADRFRRLVNRSGPASPPGAESLKATMAIEEKGT